jgi:hypothetical protein
VEGHSDQREILAAQDEEEDPAQGGYLRSRAEPRRALGRTNGLGGLIGTGSVPGVYLVSVVEWVVTVKIYSVALILLFRVASHRTQSSRLSSPLEGIHPCPEDGGNDHEKQ